MKKKKTLDSTLFTHTRALVFVRLTTVTMQVCEISIEQTNSVHWPMQHGGFTLHIDSHNIQPDLLISAFVDCFLFK